MTSDRHKRSNDRRRSGRGSSPVTRQLPPGTNRLDATFQRLRAQGKKALIAYLMAGDPGLPETEQLVLELERSGADVIELGVPFSDPIADGPVIQRAAERALRGGTSLRKILVSARSLRTKTQIPLVLMVYYNSVHAMGVDRFCGEAAAAGVDGLIVPDMPPDEAGPLKGPAEQAGLRLIFLLAPTSTAERRTYVARQSGGFLYYVSLTGITGGTIKDMAEIGKNVEKIRKVTPTPIAVGFGVSTPDDAAQVGKMADGVIVGSAIVGRIAAAQQDPAMVEHVGQFVRSLKDAIQTGSQALSR